MNQIFYHEGHDGLHEVKFEGHEVKAKTGIPII